MRHLASQAGLVLRNAALTAELQATIDELRASRRRLVEAQDAERQRIERNLHDGAQQQLVALTSSSACWKRPRRPRRRPAAGAADCAPGCMRPWMTCVPWPGGSTRRCWPTRDWPPRCARRRARPRFPSRSRPMASAATRGRPRPRRTSASSRPCKTSRSTRGLPGHSHPDLPGRAARVHRHRRRRRLRHREVHPRHRPAGHGRPAGRRGRHPPHPLCARAGHHHQRHPARGRANKFG